MTVELRKLRDLLTPGERRAALGVLALMLMGTLLETLCTGLVIPAIALLMPQEVGYPWLRRAIDALGNPDPATLVLAVVLALVAVYLVKNLLLGYVAWRQLRFAYGVQARMSLQLFALYLRQPYAFHLQRNSAQLARNAISEVGAFCDALIRALGIATEFLAVLAIATLLLLVEPLGTLISALLLGSAAAILYRSTRARVSRWGKMHQLHERLRAHHALQALGGAKEVKLLGRESDFLAQYRRHTGQSLGAAQAQATLPLFSRLALEFLAVAGIALLAITMLAQGRPLATIAPTLGLFAVAAFRLLPAVDRILQATQGLRFRAPVMEALHADLSLPVPAQPVRERLDFQAEISLNDVMFTYPERPAPAIAGVTVRVRKGECVGLVGPSGSGKSTLIDVLMGLLEPQTGTVTVDGRDIRANLRGWQDRLGYVPQTLYLTDDTLRRNVAFGIPDAEVDDEKVWRALRDAQLDEFVAGLPEGLNTAVGERGVRLSGGQRQRIGIARALYHEPAVLVLDEATSALDTATEAGVMRTVMRLKGERTVLIVAHRLSTIAGCDRVYRLENGRVAEASSGAPRAAAASD